MKILIIGADGQLGTDLCQVIPEQERVPLTIKDVDITNRELSREVLRKYSPEVVINTAAFHNVDKCEEQVEQSFAVNASGPKNLAEICRELKARLVHISTDYVFDGKKNSPYVETDQPQPLSVYAESKLAGERLVRQTLDEHFIVRSTGLYGVAGCLGKGGTNFVEGMLKRAAVQPELKVVTDEVLSPTYTLDLARKIVQLIKTRHYGLYHIVNHGSCSWYEFACKIFELLSKKIIIHRTTSAEFPSKAKRPQYSVLKNAALEKLGLDDLRSWQEALRAYLIEKKHLKP